LNNQRTGLWNRIFQGWGCGILMVSACVGGPEESTPVKVLEHYVQASFHAMGVQDKKVMESLLTGDTKARLEAWSEEQFKKAFIDERKTFKELRILENRKVSASEVILVYELSYQQGPKEKEVRITQRKLGTLVREQQDWKIKEVRNIRESIEYLEELSLP
jgi:hypothetical protein